MFRRSYYSHDIPSELRRHYPVPTHRSAYRAAVVSTNPGFNVRITQRFNRMYIQSGNSSDVTYFREQRLEIRP